ncbi:hypothetical protein UFOVP240_96 [uncultured Caudovirales phage]|uniref:Uncharacterized protein n=1 Tax=uncultured Caudovirales phage TaxID=2100421 RepID=A0A6J7WST7_9CAUD|nr:hypothetical protein UFOVP240_96 [uncultured Caudovirales phage]
MDPITIGLAFAAAQSAVGHIKQAIALGKDIHSLVGELGKFFQSADTVHTASTKAKVASLTKSDAELGRQALEFAIHSNKLREDERALKDMIYWELGKPQIWDDMIKERTRLIKEKHAAERAIEEAKHKHKQKMADLFMYGMTFVGGSVILFAVVMGGIGIYGSVQEKNEFEAKQAKRAKIIQQQRYARELEEKANTEKSAKESG